MRIEGNVEKVLDEALNFLEYFNTSFASNRRDRLKTSLMEVSRLYDFKRFTFWSTNGLVLMENSKLKYTIDIVTGRYALKDNHDKNVDVAGDNKILLEKIKNIILND